MTNEERNTNKNDIKYKSALRHNEYYNTQSIFDELYRKSTERENFHRLYDIIRSKENILLAYRNIKRNTGSVTPGTNGKTIEYWEKVDTDMYVKYMQKRLEDYHPSPIRRKFIPKPNGKERPLGIPTIEDRLIQQCIKQVLEPICEAQFHHRSYGFRPNRNTEHAIADFVRTVNLGKNYYVIDVDIKGFFDNVNHDKLIRQLWTLGIRDKKVLSVIKEMLKAPIEGISGQSTKGVPQGGILSPLLANVVLNELDWWISNQWETFSKMNKPPKVHYNTQGTVSKSNVYKELRQSKLKEMYIVRYADDFKIMCKSKDHARRTYEAVKKWLMDRLNLEVSEDKSKITNIKKESSEFLGFTFKAVKKGKRGGKDKWVIKSHMSDKAKESAIHSIKKHVKKTQKKPTEKNIRRLNAMIAGKQNYYCVATHVSIDFNEIYFKLMKVMRNRLGKPVKPNSTNYYKTREFKMRYKGNYKLFHVGKMLIYPIAEISHRNPMSLKIGVCDFTPDGRELIHKNIGHIDVELLHFIMTHPSERESIEYNDNRISLYSAQKGKCAISGNVLDYTMEVHHIKGRKLDRPDRYKNLILVTYEVHKLIHATDLKIVAKYLEMIKLDKVGLEKLNKFRAKFGNDEIVVNY